ncbi:MAG TPA: hypothetical protein PKK00_08915 [Bacteroidales bacterium]|nr:hypothetical protein [Bacteroidales bacterium]HPS17332.1 hypothetical protein [Bacteroidales bacterium]
MKKKIGYIKYNDQLFEVFWDTETKLVWCKDDKGTLTNFNDAKALAENVVIDCAKEMLKSSGL